MIPITDPRIEEYLLQLSPEDDPYLLEMEAKGHEAKFPIVDRLVGRLLYLLTRLKQPRLVVELGSGFGYSAYWIARAISISSRVVLTEYNQDNLDYAQRIFQETGLVDRADFRVGNALEIGQEYENIDLLFIDIDKYQYLEAIRAMLPRLSSNALVVADNTLWYGRVVEQESDQDSRGVRDFNRFMAENQDFFTSIIPLRDGVLLALKLG